MPTPAQDWRNLKNQVEALSKDVRLLHDRLDAASQVLEYLANEHVNQKPDPVAERSLREHVNKAKGRRH
jgi:hypothetical protein